MLRSTVALLAVAHAAGFFYVALSRAGFGFDLEWMEGLHLLHAREVLAHRVIYAAPRAEFIALPYEPLHAIVVAVAARVFGLTFAVGRAVSIASMLAISGLAGFAVFRETRRPRLALVTAAATFALFPASGFWMDLVRVDPLFVALVLAAIVYVRARASHREAPFVAALLFYIAFLSKQLALAFVPVALVAIILRRGWRASLVCLACVVGLVIADGAIGDHFTNGYYRFFTFVVPRGQPNQWSRLGLLGELLTERAGVALSLAILFFAWRAWTHRGESRRARNRVRRALVAIDGWPLAIGCGTAATIAAFVHPGGAENNLLTIEMFLPITAALLVHRVSRLRSRIARSAVTALAAIQLALLAYDPRAHVPSAASFAVADRFATYVRETPGNVLIPDHPFAAFAAQKAPSYHTNTIWELRFRLGDASIPDDLRERIRKGEYTRIITALDLAKAPRGLYPEEILAHYRREAVLDWAAPLECPVGLLHTQPRFVYGVRDGE